MTTDMGWEMRRPNHGKVDSKDKRSQELRSRIIVIGGQLAGTGPLVIALFALDWNECCDKFKNRRSMCGGGLSAVDESTRDRHAKLHPSPRARGNALLRK
jgi:hypothetical protein